MPAQTVGQTALRKRTFINRLVRASEPKEFMLGGAALFALNFFKHPQMLGTIFPSSRFLVGRVLSRIPWGQCQVIVEYGPGVGQFTIEILRRMNRSATLVGIELNPDFVSYLRREIPDPRLRLVSGSAAEVREILRRLGHMSADCIIAGIPFRALDGSQRKEILSETYAALADHGRLAVYQYSRSVQADLERTFGQVEWERELLNFVPVQLFHCVKNNGCKQAVLFGGH